MTLLAILTMILRRRALAAGGFWIVTTVVVAAAWGEWETLPVTVATTLLLTLVAARFGLLALVTHMAMFYLLMRLPALSGVDWATPLLAIPFAAVILLALWAFRTSLGSHSPFGALMESYER